MLSKIFTVLVVVFTFISCSSDDESMQTELFVNQQLWTSSQVKNYKWSESLSCECGGPLLREIIVVNNSKVNVVFDESLLFEGYTREDVFEASNTIEEAFIFIQSLLNHNVASLFVEYDETYGFPTSISIDYDKDYIDDEIFFRYTNFEIPL